MPDAADLRCPTCGAPLDMSKVRPGQTTLACDYCGAAVPVAPTSRPPTIHVTSDGVWGKGGWAGDPRIWMIFGLLVMGLVAFLVFGHFGPQ